MKRLAPILFLPLLLLLLAGCKPSIVGKWSGNVPVSVPGRSIDLPTTMEFNKDGTTVSTSTLGARSLTLNGTYTINNDSLTTTYTKSNLPVPLPGILNNPQTGTYKIDGETLTITRTGNPITLTRVKDAK